MATQIIVHTSPASAILTRSRAGRHFLEIDLLGDGWSDEECGVLAEMVDKDGEVKGNVAPPTIAAVRELVTGVLEKRRAEVEAKAERMQELLDAPLDSLLDAGRGGWYATSSKLEKCCAHHGDIVAARPDVVAEISLRNAARMEMAIRLFIEIPIDEWPGKYQDIETPEGEKLPGEPTWNDMGLFLDGMSTRSDDPRVSEYMARRNEFWAAKRAAEQAAKDAELAAAAAARSEWIAEHGSPRLKACVAEDIECEAIYKDERMEHRRNWLASVLPGWELYEDMPWCVHQDGPRNPPAVALETLARARDEVAAAGLNLLGNKLITEVGKVELEYYRHNGEPGYCAYLEVTMQDEAVGLVLLAEETQEHED